MHSHSEDLPTGRNDRGGTFIEALLALSLLAVACGGAAPAARSAASALARMHRLTEGDRLLARADGLLRRSVARVRFPPRAAVVTVERLPGGLRIGFVDGDPQRFLDLRYRSGVLVVSDGVEVERVPGVSSATFLFLYGDDGTNRPSPVPVVCARIESAGGVRAEICANVGSWPLLPARLEIRGDG